MNRKILIDILNEIKNLNSSYDFWFSLIEIICTLVLIIPVIVLIKERIEKDRPKVIVNFEIIRSSLACIVIRNISNNPAELISLKFNEEFLNELNPKLREKLNGLKNTKIYIGPNQKWIINFETNIFNIIEDFKTNICIIEYIYVPAGKSKTIKEVTEINFKNYSFFTLYISELDEINQTLKKIDKTLNTNKINNYIPNPKLIESCDLKDSFKKFVKGD